MNYVPSNAHAPSGGAYAKPAQSAAARCFVWFCLFYIECFQYRAKDLKRRSANAKSRGSSSQQSSVIEETPAAAEEEN